MFTKDLAAIGMRRNKLWDRNVPLLMETIRAIQSESSVSQGVNRVAFTLRRVYNISVPRFERVRVRSIFYIDLVSLNINSHRYLYMYHTHACTHGLLRPVSSLLQQCVQLTRLPLFGEFITASSLDRSGTLTVRCMVSLFIELPALAFIVDFLLVFVFQNAGPFHTMHCDQK